MFIGRGREVQGLEQLLAAAAAGRGGLRVIHGQPGIGKTRLADELARVAEDRGFLVAWGRAWETGGAPAYWPWLEVLEVLVEADANVPPKVRDLVGRAPRQAPGEGTRADPARERFEVFEAVASYLRSRARATPLLLVFDDLHMADGATLELLSFVARGLRPARIAVIATWRDAEARAERVAEALVRIAREGEGIPLHGLPPEDVAEVVRHELGRFDNGLSTRLFELTEGNPLFLVETLRAVSVGAGGDTVDRLREVAVGGGVQALVRGRLRDAPPELRSSLEIASVFGREATLGRLAEVMGDDEGAVRRRLDDAVSRGLLVRRGQDRWAFSHVLVREAFYRDLPEDVARSVHAKIAAALARRIASGAAGASALLPTQAHHALEALPVGDVTDAVRLACMAARGARAQLAYEEAMALLERALVAAVTFDAPDQTRAEVMLALGWASTEGARFERGREMFREAAGIARRVGDARLLARAALGQGGVYVLAEIRGELVDVLREALTLLEGSDAPEDVRLRARVLARLAAALTPSATPEEPLGLARQALSMAEGEADIPTRLDIDVGVGAAYADFAPPAERVPVNERLLRDARSLGDRVLELRALTRLACDHMERGAVAAADAVIATRAALANSVGHPRYQWPTPLLLSMRAMIDGRFDECEALVSEARSIAAEALDPNSARCIEVHRLSMLFVAGRPHELVQQEAPTLKVLDGLPDGAAFGAWVTATIASHTGDHARAAALVAQIGTNGIMTAPRMPKVTLAEVAVRAGVRDIAGILGSRLAPDEDANTCWGPFGFNCGPPIARVQAQIAFMFDRRDEAARHWERALALSTRMKASAHLAWVHLTWGEGTGDRSHLEKAAEHAEAHGMPEILERVHAALDRAPSGPPRSSRTAASSGPFFTMKLDGVHWVIERAGRSFRLKDVRGFGMLARLLECAGAEVHALELAFDPETAQSVDRGDAGEVLDARARDAYKRRIGDLREELEEAERFADPVRASRLRDELEMLTRELAAAVGLGGRERRTGSSAERARITVQRRVKEAIRKIGDQDPELGQHLDWTVRTGMYCAYEPEGKRK